MDQKVRKYVQDQHMIEKTDRVLAGVSGGADSICLLFVLLELQKELGFELRAVHVNHQIRGADADSDQEYVETVCKEQGVDLVVYKEDVPKYAEKHKLTEEEAGREVRRFAFLRQMELWGGTKIALAHHRNDTDLSPVPRDGACRTCRYCSGRWTVDSSAFVCGSKRD